MNYTLNQLQIFSKIVQTGSITRAAEELHLTQPAVSIQLRNFQHQFDLPLTEVIGRKIFITDFGREIAAATERILNEVQVIDYKTLEYKGHLTGRLKISVVSTGKYVMPYFLSDFMRDNSGVQLAMDVTNKAQVIDSLVNNQVDFSLVSVIPPKMAIDKLDLLQNKLFLIGNTKTKFKGRMHDKRIFDSLPLIYREQGSATRQAMERFIERNKIMAYKKIELTSNEAVKQAVLAGLGYSIMPLIGIKNELNTAQLQIIPVRGFPLLTTWSLVWPKDKRHSPIALAFLNHIKKEKRSIVDQHFSWYESYA